jgi:hypothetical protein
MRALLISCVACWSLALSGCKSVYSAHPLHTSEDAVEEPGLEGQWKAGSDSDGQLCIQKGDGNFYKMVVSAADSKDNDESKSGTDSEANKPKTLLESYKITLVRLDDQVFADMVASGQSVDGTEIEPPVGALHHYIIMKVQLAGDELGYSLLERDTIRAANEQGYAPLSYVEIDDDFLLTASTEELRWAASHYADRLFHDSEMHYTRVVGTEADGSSPCAAVTPAS